MDWRWDCDEEFDVRAADNETLGESNLRPFDGERAEKRWCDVEGASCVAVVVIEATEPCDVLRRPAKDIDSRLALRGIEPTPED